MGIGVSLDVMVDIANCICYDNIKLPFSYLSLVVGGGNMNRSCAWSEVIKKILLKCLIGKLKPYMLVRV